MAMVGWNGRMEWSNGMAGREGRMELTGGISRGVLPRKIIKYRTRWRRSIYECILVRHHGKARDVQCWYIDDG